MYRADKKHGLKDLARNAHKAIRVDPVLYQALIPPEHRLDKGEVRAGILARQAYQHDRLPRKVVSDYLEFVDWLMSENEADGILLGSTGKEKHHENALEFLGKMNYSVVRAKFYILFPCLQYASRFSGETLDLTEAQMQSEIDSHLDSLHNHRAKAGQRWRVGLDSLLKERASLQRVVNYLDQAKAMKLEVPEHIRDEVDAVNRASREIKRMLNAGKHSYEDLLAKKELVEGFRIQTSEFVQIKNVMDRVQAWRERRMQLEHILLDPLTGRTHPSKKVAASALLELKSELESLPLADSSPLFGSLLEEVGRINAELASLRIQDFIEKRDRPSAKEAVRIIQLLEQAPIESEEQERIKVSLKNALLVRERVLMWLEDSAVEDHSAKFKAFI